MNKKVEQNLWSFIWHFLKPYKGFVFSFIFLAIIAGSWGPFNNLLIKYIINILSSSDSVDTSLLIYPAVLLVLNFIIFDNLAWRSIAYLNYKYEPLIKNQVTIETYEYVLDSSSQFFQNNLSGRIASQITTLAENMQRIIHHISPDFIKGFSLLIISFFSMYLVNPRFFWTLSIWFIVFASFSIILSKRIVHLSDEQTAAESDVAGQLVDTLSNNINVRIFARKNNEISRLSKDLDLTKEKFQTKEWFLIKLHFAQGLLIAIMLAIMLYFLIQLKAAQLVTIGDFALIIGLSLEVGYMSWFTLNQIDSFNQAIGKCKQSLSSLFVPLDIKNKENAADLNVTKGEINFTGVMFHYKDQEILFKNKSVTIKAGQKVGLVGYSGSGKSTFVNLILRLYDVREGSINIDGQNIKDVTQDSLRKNISIIPQDPSLFHRSLMENIRYGRMEASDEEVIEAAKRAHAHDFIMSMPEGYNSPVGERGVKLSGGQRQRIAIARAILKNAPILILDEATSQLDSVTEQYIQNSLWKLMQGKTTLVIAHRLSTLLYMDRIIVFDRGKIVGDDTHVELLKKGGLYRTLWNAQVGGLLPYHADAEL